MAVYKGNPYVYGGQDKDGSTLVTGEMYTDGAWTPLSKIMFIADAHFASVALP
jgi:hypothetical protein